MITKLSQLKQDQTYLVCIHIEYILIHDSIRWDLVWPQSISPRTSPARRARARVPVSGLLEPRWPCEGTVSHVGAAPGRAVGTQVTPRTRGARPCCAPGANRPGRTRLGRHVGQRPRGLAASRHAGRAEPLGGCPRAGGRIRTPPGRGRAGRAAGRTEKAAASSRRASASHVTGPRALAAAEGRGPAPCRGAMAGPGGARGWGRAAPGELQLHASSRTRARSRAAPAELQAARAASTGRRERRSTLVVWERRE
jgi:hypothetical protein